MSTTAIHIYFNRSRFYPFRHFWVVVDFWVVVAVVLESFQQKMWGNQTLFSRPCVRCCCRFQNLNIFCCNKLEMENRQLGKWTFFVCWFTSSVYVLRQLTPYLTSLVEWLEAIDGGQTKTSRVRSALLPGFLAVFPIFINSYFKKNWQHQKVVHSVFDVSFVSGANFS